jgi:hypothetical protein
MVNEKRLIDANALTKMCREQIRSEWNRNVCPESWSMAYEDFLEAIDDAPTVDAVEVEKYNRLVEAYHELRENFVDFVCSGIPNVAPYCLNRCDGCCDAYGWCRQSDRCQGFNPAEVILDGERKDNDL